MRGRQGPAMARYASGGSTGGGSGSGKKFIQDAIKRPGALTRKAKAAGQSVAAFARAHAHDSGLTGQQARFYLNVLRKVNRGR
jgi:hypothetical protein